MDDTTRQSAVFEINGHQVTAKKPTEGQMTVLVMSRNVTTDDVEGAVRLGRRIISVLEALIGQHAWDTVIERGMIAGEITPQQMIEFAGRIFAHDWSGTDPETDPDAPTAEELALIKKMRAGA